MTYRIISTKTCICFELGKHLEGVQKSQQSRKCCKINLHPIRMTTFNLGKHGEARHDCLHRQLWVQANMKTGSETYVFLFWKGLDWKEMARWATLYAIYKSLCESQNESCWEVNRSHLLGCTGGRQEGPNTYMLGEAATKFHGAAFDTYLSVQSVGVKVSN